MKKFISLILAIGFIFSLLVPVADASIRIRRSALNQPNTVYVPYYPQQQTYQQSYQNYVVPQQYQTAGNTYYFSPIYVSGYTFYSTPTPGYYLYNSNPTTTSNIQQGKYYFSQNYVSGYTYYSTPTPGYYYYLGTTPVDNNQYYNNSYYNNTPVYPANNSNMICTIINSRYQCVTNTYGPNYATYPGCSAPDIIIGGQIWASCNAIDRNLGSTNKTGWFFAGDRESSFTSYNGNDTALEWMGKQTRESSWNIGPCATGYRLPTQGEWNTLQSYARAGNTTISSLISLGQNGSYQGSRNTNGDITITGRLSATAAYWSSSVESGVPIVMHVGSTYQGYNTTGTDYGYVNSGYQWTYGDTGLSLLRATTGELANVRCMRN